MDPLGPSDTSPHGRVPKWLEEPLRLAGDVLDRLRGGGPLHLVARASGESGSNPLQLVRNSMQTCIRSFEEASGAKLPDVLPSTERLAQLFKEAPRISSKERGTGRPFSHRVVVMDRTRDLGLLLTFILGSGRKTDEHRQSPAATILADLLATHAPALTWAARVDRLLRHHWAAGPLMMEIEYQESYIGDSRRGPRKLEGPESMMIFWEFSNANAEARVLPERTREGFRNHTDAEMKDGRLGVGVGRPAPPGFARLKLRADNKIGSTVWVLDTPEVLEGIAPEVAAGLPQVLTADGGPADQVANVRFALSHLGKPGWNWGRLAVEMERRGWSTDIRRSLHGSGAVLPATDGRAHKRSGSDLLASLRDNLEMYETGELTVKIGGGETMVVRNLFPLDGPWASAEDFARIRCMEGTNRQMFNARADSTFTGLVCTVDGVPSLLVSDSMRRLRDQRCLMAVRSDEWPYRTLRSTRSFRLPRREFAELIVDAIARAGSAPLQLLAVEDEEAELVGLRSKRDRERSRLAQLSASRDAILAELRGETGYQPDGALKERLNDDYNARHADVVDAERRLEDLELELEGARRQLRDEQAPARSEQLLALVQSLRDPGDKTYRSVWLTAIQNLVFSTDKVMVGGVQTTRVKVEGRLVFGHEADSFWVPIEGELYTSDAEAVLERRVEEIIDQMRQGIPFGEVDVPMAVYMRKEVAARFKATPRTSMALACADPRVLRLMVALIVDNKTVAQVAEESGEPRVLVERVLELNRDADPHGWRQRRARALSVAYSVAAANGGVALWTDLGVASGHRAKFRYVLANYGLSGEWNSVYGEGLRLTATCRTPGCGSMRRAVFKNPEPKGLVCLECRRDDAGVLWPSDPYDQYLAHPELWQEGAGEVQG